MPELGSPRFGEDTTIEEYQFHIRRSKSPALLLVVAVLTCAWIAIDLGRTVDWRVYEELGWLIIPVLVAALLWLGIELRNEMDTITLDYRGLRVCRGKRELQCIPRSQVQVIVYCPGVQRRRNDMLGIGLLSPQMLIQKELDIQNRSPLNPSGLTYGQLSPGMRKRFLLDYAARQVRRRYRTDGDFIWMDYTKSREAMLLKAFQQAEIIRD